MYKVQLAVYDLSRGMARMLFSQMFPPNSGDGDMRSVDCIPHTALLVHGKEYFFGSGIQVVANIPQFRSTMGMHPFQIVDMGTTAVSCAAFETWLHQQQSNADWAADTYDLFHHNCNHFSHTAALQGLRLSKGIPDWILQVPSTVLSTPLGQQLYPFLQQVNNFNGGGVSSSSSSSSFVPMTAGSSSTTAYAHASSTSSAGAPATAIAYASSSSSAAASSSSYNPWATSTATSTASVPPAAAPPSRGVVSSASSVASNASSKGSATSSTSPPRTPILNTYSQPLVSNNTQAVPLCIAKLKHYDPTLRANFILSHFDSTKPPSNNHSVPSSIIVQRILTLCSKVTEDANNTKLLTFALMLLRLVVLMKDGNTSADANGDNVPSGHHSDISSDTTQVVFDWMQANEGSLLQNQTCHTAMTYCIWSNMISTWKEDRTAAVDASRLEWMLEYVLRDVTSSQAQLQQAALCVLYNLAWWKSVEQQTCPDDDIDEITVTLICASVQGLLDQMMQQQQEWQLVTRLMALLGRLIVNSSGTRSEVVALIQDLGLHDALREWAVVQEPAAVKEDSVKCIGLAKELVSLLG